jgi:ribosome maturation protein Sdo1
MGTGCLFEDELNHNCEKTENEIAKKITRNCINQEDLPHGKLVPMGNF